MALKVKDLVALNSLKDLKLEAGKKGLNRYVSNAGRVDYEFLPEFRDEYVKMFEKGTFLLTSLLSFKGQPENLLPMICELNENKVAGLAYKKVIYDSLPEEVIDYCDEKGFPLFSYQSETHIESMIFDIIDTIRSETATVLSGANLRSMIKGGMSREQVVHLAGQLSFPFKNYVRATYISTGNTDYGEEAERVFRNFQANEKFSKKALLCRYGTGLFALITAEDENEYNFDRLQVELMEELFPGRSDVWCCSGDVHEPLRELDYTFAESWQTYEASLAEGCLYQKYEDIGAYQYLIPQSSSVAMRSFADKYTVPLEENCEFSDTLEMFVRCGGDYNATGIKLHVHKNTIRYRIGKIKKILSLDTFGEAEFFAITSTAVRLKQISRVRV